MRQSGLILIMLIFLAQVGSADMMNGAEVSRKIDHIFSNSVNGSALVHDLKSLKERLAPMHVGAFEQQVLELSQAKGRPEALAAGPSPGDLAEAQLCDPSLILQMKLAKVNFESSEPRQKSFSDRIKRARAKHAEKESESLAAIKEQAYDLTRGWNSFDKIKETDRRLHHYRSYLGMSEKNIAMRTKMVTDEAGSGMYYTLGCFAYKGSKDWINEIKARVACGRAQEISTKTLPDYQKKKTQSEANHEALKEAFDAAQLGSQCESAEKIANLSRDELLKDSKIKDLVKSEILVADAQAKPYLTSSYWANIDLGGDAAQASRTAAYSPYQGETRPTRQGFASGSQRSAQ